MKEVEEEDEKMSRNRNVLLASLAHSSMLAYAYI